jgi:hypothetical protein
MSSSTPLGSFTFNLGGGRLQGSTLRARLNRGDYEGAAEQFPRWVYAGGKLKGLLRRRLAEGHVPPAPMRRAPGAGEQVRSVGRFAQPGGV